MDDELLDDFLQECEDILARIATTIESIERSGLTDDDIDSLFRNVHTLKGGAGMFSMSQAMEHAHELETNLGLWQKDISGFNLKYLIAKIDIVSSLILDGASDIPAASVDIAEPIVQKEPLKNKTLDTIYFEDFLETFIEIIENDLQAKSIFYECIINKNDGESFVSKLEKMSFEKYADQNLDDNKMALLLLVKDENSTSAAMVIEKLSKVIHIRNISNVADVISGAKVVPIEVKSKSEAVFKGVKDPKKAKKPKQNVVRVPIEKINQVLNSVWEIFLIRNQISYLFEKNKSIANKNLDIFQDWEILDNTLQRNISELESTAMSMRMTTLDSLFSRMKKVVRTYLGSSDKQINFQTTGEGIELDKKVLDMLGEPLIHLVRNAMDHGIENVDDRKLKHKSEMGNVTLSAEMLSDKVILKLTDDGNGIDGDRLLEKAKDKNIDVSWIKEKSDAIDLIFSSGFSTAEQVTDVSGRGVGMDVVRRSIHQLGGDIYVSTELNKGSVFTIELPLSMSVISSILFEVNDCTYAASINNVIEICRETEDVFDRNNNDVFYSYRGQYIKCYDLRDHFGDRKSDAENDSLFSICILNINDEVVAVQVEKVIKHTTIVVKEMSGLFPKINCVTGVSILATGDPIFVISMIRALSFIKNNSKEQEHVA